MREDFENLKAQNYSRLQIHLFFLIDPMIEKYMKLIESSLVCLNY